VGFIIEKVEDQPEIPVHFYKPQNALLNAVNDHDLQDVIIPYNDIYSQEFYFYAYSFLNKGNDRKSQHESKEGFTYIR